MSGGINVLIDEIEAIAQHTRGPLADDAQQGATTFANKTLDAGAFAGIPEGLAFHAQQDAAHQVFVATIRGVVADLEQFGETLAANAASHRAVDESNADTLTAMEARKADEQAAAAAMSQVNQQYSGKEPDLQSEEVYDEERTGNEALDVDPALDAGATPGGDTTDVTTPDSGAGPPPTEPPPVAPDGVGQDGDPSSGSDSNDYRE